MIDPGDNALLDCIAHALEQDGALAEAIVSSWREAFLTPLSRTLAERPFRDIIKRKNPYLYRASGIRTVPELVDRALSDFVSSSAEGLFGTFLEHLAIALPGNVKAPGLRVDIVRQVGRVSRLYTLKSGPAGFNSSSFADHRRKLHEARRLVQQGPIRAQLYIGFVYGRKKTTVRPDDEITILSSPHLWSHLSGDDDFYRKLLLACGCLAPAYHIIDTAVARQRMLGEAERLLGTDQGEVDWAVLLALVSG